MRTCQAGQVLHHAVHLVLQAGKRSMNITHSVNGVNAVQHREQG
jgi:hypothetical protein